MSLTAQQKKHFRTIGHHLKPVVAMGGKGLTESFLTELERAIEDHELIKVKIAVEDREDKAAVKEAIIEHTGAELVQSVGHVLLLYRAAKKPDPRKSNLLRTVEKKS